MNEVGHEVGRIGKKEQPGQPDEGTPLSKRCPPGDDGTENQRNERQAEIVDEVEEVGAPRLPSPGEVEGDTPGAGREDEEDRPSLGGETISRSRGRRSRGHAPVTASRFSLFRKKAPPDSGTGRVHPSFDSTSRM